MFKKILLLFVLCFFLLTPLIVLGQIKPPVFTPQVEVPGFGKVGETITVERGTFARELW